MTVAWLLAIVVGIPLAQGTPARSESGPYSGLSDSEFRERVNRDFIEEELSQTPKYAMRPPVGSATNAYFEVSDIYDTVTPLADVFHVVRLYNTTHLPLTYQAATRTPAGAFLNEVTVEVEPSGWAYFYWPVDPVVSGNYLTRLRVIRMSPYGPRLESEEVLTSLMGEEKAEFFRNAVLSNSLPVVYADVAYSSEPGVLDGAAPAREGGQFRISQDVLAFEAEGESISVRIADLSGPLDRKASSVTGDAWYVVPYRSKGQERHLYLRPAGNPTWFGNSLVNARVRHSLQEARK